MKATPRKLVTPRAEYSTVPPTKWLSTSLEGNSRAFAGPRHCKLHRLSLLQERTLLRAHVTPPCAPWSLRVGSCSSYSQEILLSAPTSLPTRPAAQEESEAVDRLASNVASLSASTARPRCPPSPPTPPLPHALIFALGLAVTSSWTGYFTDHGGVLLPC